MAREVPVTVCSEKNYNEQTNRKNFLETLARSRR